MKFCRFDFAGEELYGRIDLRADGTAWIEEILTEPPLPVMEGDAAHLIAIYRERAEKAALRFTAVAVDEAELLPPVKPSKIICVGRNYRDHAKELGNEVPASPLIFFKPPSSLLAPGGVVKRPKVSERVDYEGELAVVIGRRVHKMKAVSDWRGAVLGFTLANDVTARDLQKPDGQWTRAKGFDTFCPLGPWVTDEIDPMAGLEIETRVNGEVRQQGNTRDFIFALPVLMEYISGVMTLEPGDLILTGTPAGVGPVVAGDQVEVAMPGLGVLRNTFADE